MADKFLMKGNEALAEAAIKAGCRHYFGYPITPQTEVAEYMAKRMPQVDGTFLQAESELAAINMVLGAASAGVRALTSSSSPGISLKSEGISYIIGSDLPCVVINVMRGGPGLGGIQPSQADYWQATKALGHGDQHAFVFAPSSVQEMVDIVFEAFDKADEYRMPAMILADGMLGQMMEPISFPEVEVKKHDKSWATNGHQNKREHNIINSLYIQPQELEDLVVKRFQKYAEIEKKHQKSESYLTDDADLVIVAYGSTARIARSAVNTARAKGYKVGLFRPVTLWPFPKDELGKIAGKVKNYLCVEMSMGQMVDDVKLVVGTDKNVNFFGHTGGIVPSPAEVLAQIEKILGGVK